MYRIRLDQCLEVLLQPILYDTDCLKMVLFAQVYRYYGAFYSDM